MNAKWAKIDFWGSKKVPTFEMTRAPYSIPIFLPSGFQSSFCFYSSSIGRPSPFDTPWCTVLKKFLRVQNISIFFLDTFPGSSTNRSWSSHGYDHNSFWPAFWSRNRPPHPDPWNQRPQRPWSPHPPTDVCWYIWTICSFIWARQLVPFPLCLSIPFRLPWPTFPAPFATSDDHWSLTFLQQTKLLPMKPYLLFAFLAGRKSNPFIFQKIFTNLPAHSCYKYSQNLPSSTVLPKHQTLQEFWHSY